MTSSYVLVVVASLVLSIGTLVQLFSSPAFLQPLIDECATTKPPSKLDRFYATHFVPLDTFLCFITPFFEAVLETRLGVGIFWLIAENFCAAALYACVEASREGRPSYLGLLAAFTFILGQAIGISAAFPFVFIPAFLLSKKSSQGVSDASAIFATILVAIGAANMTAIPLGPVEYRRLMIAVFQVAPVIFLLLPAFNLVVGGKPGNAIIYVYTIAAIAFTFLHLYAVYVMFSEATFSELFELAIRWGRTGPESAVAFLLVDSLSLGTSLVLLAFAQQRSFSGFVQFLVISVFIGPGAALLFDSIVKETSGTAINVRTKKE